MRDLLGKALVAQLPVLCHLVRVDPVDPVGDIGVYLREVPEAHLLGWGDHPLLDDVDTALGRALVPGLSHTGGQYPASVVLGEPSVSIIDLGHMRSCPIGGRGAAVWYEHVRNAADGLEGAHAPVQIQADQRKSPHPENSRSRVRACRKQRISAQ